MSLPFNLARLLVVLLLVSGVGAMSACSDDPISSSEEDTRGLPPSITVQEPAGPFNLGKPLVWTAAVSDSDPGDVVEVEWVFSDESGATVGTVSGLEATHTFSVAGTYTVVATATDQAGLTDVWTGDVTVRNAAPTISVDAPKGPFGPGNTYSWTASVSDPDLENGDSVTVRWTFSGGTGRTDGLTATRTFPDTGSYTIKVVATDMGGLTAEWVDTIVVNNAAPRIDVTAPEGPFKVGVPVRWTATVVDPNMAEGDSVSVIWSFSDGKGSATGLSVTRTFDEPGLYTISAVAIDRGGLSAGWTREISVALPNSAPTIRVVPPSNHKAGTPLTWAAVVSDPDAGDSLVVTWTFSDVGGSSKGLTATRTFTAAGSYTVTATVTDKGGLKDSWQETFTLSNQAPIAKISGPTGPLELDKDYTLSAAGSSDPEGGALIYSWSIEGDPTVLGTGRDLVIQQSIPGTYVYRLNVMDDKGANMTTIVTLKFVGDAEPPYLGAVTGPAVPVVGDVETYSVRVMDANGDLASVVFDWGDGTDSTIAKTLAPGVEATIAVKHSYAAAGSFTITVTATDTLGNHSTKTMSVAPTTTIAFMKSGFPTSGLVAAWDPSNTSAGSLKLADASSSGRHCILGSSSSTATNAPDRSEADGVLRFDGSEMFVDCAQSVIGGISANWTIVSVIKPASGQQALFGTVGDVAFTSASKAYQTISAISDRGELGVTVMSKAGSRGIVGTSATAGAWATLSLTNSAASKTRVWTNTAGGSSDLTSTTLGGGVPTNGHVTLGAGCLVVSTGTCAQNFFYKGDMGPVLIYNRELSQAELIQAHNALRKYGIAGGFAYQTLVAK